MADEEEQIFTINLRRVWSVPRTQRVPRAVKEVRRFVLRHLKAEEKTVWVDPHLNEVLWRRGREKPPRYVQVRVISITEPEELIQISPVEPEAALKEGVEEAKEEEAEAEGEGTKREVSAEVKKGEGEEGEPKGRPAAEETPKAETKKGTPKPSGRAKGKGGKARPKGKGMGSGAKGSEKSKGKKVKGKESEEG